MRMSLGEPPPSGVIRTMFCRQLPEAAVCSMNLGGWFNCVHINCTFNGASEHKAFLRELFLLSRYSYGNS